MVSENRLLLLHCCPTAMHFGQCGVSLGCSGPKHCLYFHISEGTKIKKFSENRLIFFHMSSKTRWKRGTRHGNMFQNTIWISPAHPHCCWQRYMAAEMHPAAAREGYNFCSALLSLCSMHKTLKRISFPSNHPILLGCKWWCKHWVVCNCFPLFCPKQVMFAYMYSMDAVGKPRNFLKPKRMIHMTEACWSLLADG